MSPSLHSCKSVPTRPLFGELALLPFWDLKALPEDVLQVNKSMYAYTASFVTVCRWIDIARLYILTSLYPHNTVFGMPAILSLIDRLFLLVPAPYFLIYLYPYDTLFGRPAILALMDRLFQSFPLCGYVRCVSIVLAISVDSTT